MLSPSSGTLFPSPWPSLLCYLLHRVLYSLHPGKVCYVISFIGYFLVFTPTSFVVLSPPVQPDLFSYSRLTDKVCRLARTPRDETKLLEAALTKRL